MFGVDPAEGAAARSGPPGEAPALPSGVNATGLWFLDDAECETVLRKAMDGDGELAEYYHLEKEGKASTRAPARTLANPIARRAYSSTHSVPRLAIQRELGRALGR